MSKGKRYTDGQLLEALLQCGTVEAAAQSCGCSKRTIYTRLQDSAFAECLRAYRTERIRAAAGALDSAVLDAVNALTEILHSEDASPSDKLKAAGMVLDMSPRYADRLLKAENATRAAANVIESYFDDMQQRDIWENVDER